MPEPTRRLTSPIFAVLAVAALVLLMGAGAQTAEAATCRLSQSEQYPKGGVPTYNLSLKVSGTSCSTGKKVARAYHSCRSKRSVSCSKKVNGRHWKCSGRKTDSISTQFTGTYTCKYGKRRVSGSFQQNT